MIVFSTVLQVNGNPTLYNVYKNKALAFLNPTRFKRDAPIIFAKQSGSDWHIKGTNDVNLVKQVINEIND